MSTQNDNRVRPPKAAAKLVPGTWRHIRLENAFYARQAEDAVVLWAHYAFPEDMPGSKAASLMNYEMGAYTAGG